MIATYGSNASPGSKLDRSFNHTRARWPSVDKITQQDDCGIRTIPKSIVSFNFKDQLFEKVQPAMNIADSIYSFARRNPVSLGYRRALEPLFEDACHGRNMNFELSDDPKSGAVG